MKKILLLLLLSIMSTISYAQWYGRFVDVPAFQRTEYRVANFPNRLIWTSRDSIQFSFYADTIKFIQQISRNEGTPYKLMWIDASGVLHTSVSPYLVGADTTNISNKLSTKLSIVDTTGKWQPVGNYVLVIDTANMLLPYLRKVDTASLSNRITLKLNIGDTSTMLISYLRKIDTLSLSNRINTKLNFSDTSSMLSPYLRKSDTITLSNRINLKLNLSDTANMLLPYLRKIDTTSLSNRINNKVNIGDTATMLLPYARKATLKTPVSYTGTTDAGGLFSVTYAVAYAVIPNVQFQIRGGAVTNTIRLTASTTSGFTVYVQNRVDALGLLPSYQNVSGATVDILVIDR